MNLLKLPINGSQFSNVLKVSKGRRSNKIPCWWARTAFAHEWWLYQPCPRTINREPTTSNIQLAPITQPITAPTAAWCYPGHVAPVVGQHPVHQLAPLQGLLRVVGLVLVPVIHVRLHQVPRRAPWVRHPWVRHPWITMDEKLPF